MGYRTLAVGSCNVNGLEFLLRISHGFAQGDGIAEIGFVGRLPNSLEHRKPGVQIVQRFRVGHLFQDENKGHGSNLLFSRIGIGVELGFVSGFFRNFCEVRTCGG